MISQDRHQIWITVAKFSRKYLDFLNGKGMDDTITGYLEIREYGPWDIGAQDHMEHVGEMLLAITLQLCREES